MNHLEIVLATSHTWERVVSNRILFITNDFGPRAGGIETFIHGLIERLPKNSVTVYTSSQGDTKDYDQSWLTNYGVKVIRDRAKVLLPTPRVVRNVAKIDTDVVVFGAAAPLALMANKLTARKKIAITHGHEVWWAKIPPFSFAIKKIGQNVDHLTYLGSFTKKAIEKGLRSEDISKLIQIAPGIDTNHFQPRDSSGLKASLGLADKKVIVSVGRLVPRKGQDQLIRALPRIRKAIPNIHLFVVGRGPYLKKLEKLVDKHGVRDCVTFTGRVQYEDLPRYICVGDIFAMPARDRLFGLEVEGLGIVYLEASSCGLPVVVGNSGGAPDAVKDGITGSVVNGRRVKKIATEIIKILEGKPTMMGGLGREWALSYWTWDNWSKKFNQLILDDAQR